MKAILSKMRWLIADYWQSFTKNPDAKRNEEALLENVGIFPGSREVTLDIFDTPTGIDEEDPELFLTLHERIHDKLRDKTNVLCIFPASSGGGSLKLNFMDKRMRWYDVEVWADQKRWRWCLQHKGPPCLVANGVGETMIKAMEAAIREATQDNELCPLRGCENE